MESPGAYPTEPDLWGSADPLSLTLAAMPASFVRVRGSPHAPHHPSQSRERQHSSPPRPPGGPAPAAGSRLPRRRHPPLPSAGPERGPAAGAHRRRRRPGPGRAPALPRSSPAGAGAHARRGRAEAARRSSETPVERGEARHGREQPRGAAARQAPAPPPPSLTHSPQVLPLLLLAGELGAAGPVRPQQLLLHQHRRHLANCSHKE